MHLYELTKTLISIPSITGEESAIADYLHAFLSEHGFEVMQQTVEGPRRNLLARTAAEPRVVLCTHLDTVPPFLAAREDSRRIFGRGACDAKGILAAMICAALALRRQGVSRFALLFLVGEETDSLGARAANRLGVRSDYIVVGEPTENKLGVGHKGLVSVRLTAKGKSAHSAFPELGDSAIQKLLEALERVRRTRFGSDPVLGESGLNFGTLSGGVAHNVIPDHAEATLSIRNTVPSEQAIATLEEAVPEGVEVEVLSSSEPQRLHTLPGYETTVLPFGTDIPHLRSFGKALLVGPGSATVAHTPEEHIGKRQLTAAVDLYVNLVKQLLEEP